MSSDASGRMPELRRLVRLRSEGRSEIESLPSQTSSTALQLRFTQNDIYETNCRGSFIRLFLAISAANVFAGTQLGEDRVRSAINLPRQRLFNLQFRNNAWISRWTAGLTRSHSMDNRCSVRLKTESCSLGNRFSAPRLMCFSLVRRPPFRGRPNGRTLST